MFKKSRHVAGVSVKIRYRAVTEGQVPVPHQTQELRPVGVALPHLRLSPPRHYPQWTRYSTLLRYPLLYFSVFRRYCRGYYCLVVASGFALQSSELIPLVPSLLLLVNPCNINWG